MPKFLKRSIQENVPSTERARGYTRSLIIAQVRSNSILCFFFFYLFILTIRKILRKNVLFGNRPRKRNNIEIINMNGFVATKDTILKESLPLCTKSLLRINAIK